MYKKTKIKEPANLPTMTSTFQVSLTQKGIGIFSIFKKCFSTPIHLLHYLQVGRLALSNISHKNKEVTACQPTANLCQPTHRLAALNFFGKKLHFNENITFQVNRIVYCSAITSKRINLVGQSQGLYQKFTFYTFHSSKVKCDTKTVTNLSIGINIKSCQRKK